MDTDTDATLQEYQIQLEQVELALRSDPNNQELQKLKEDLIEVLTLTKELLDDELEKTKHIKHKTPSVDWKSGDICAALWRADGKYYSAVVDQIFEDGSCTVVFDGYTNPELTTMNQLQIRPKNALTLSKETSMLNKPGPELVKVALNKKELETKLKEARKRKKEKFMAKMKALEEAKEKDKNDWQSFNKKVRRNVLLASKTWKGVVKKNRFDLPAHHENKVGVGASSLSNRVVTPGGLLVKANTSAQAAAQAQKSSQPARHTTASYKTSLH